MNWIKSLRGKSARLPAAVLLIAILAAACSSGGPSTAQPAATDAGPTSPPIVVTVTPGPTLAAQPPVGQTAAAPGSGGKSATIAFVQDFDSLNPLYAQALSAIYAQPLYACRAWDFDDQGAAVPRLVAEMPSLQNGGISEDGRVITLKLREDLVWSDGQPLTAQDFVFTYQMIVDPSNAVNATAPYDQVESVTAPDERTVVVTFKQPYAAWMSALWHAVLPKHILEPVFTAQGNIQNAEWNRAPTVGCGPFVFAGWEAGQSARFIANERYWLGRPKLDEIVVRFVADDNAKVAALQSGEADLSVFLINSALYVNQLRNAGLQILPGNSGYVEGWFFYLDPVNGHPALQDVNVRRAIAMGLDRDRLIRDLLGSGQPAASIWDNTPYKEASIQPWAYDPERARQLLDEAGWVDSNGNGTRDKNGVELTLTHGTTTNEVRQAVQNLAKIQLAEIGVTLEPVNYDSSIFFGGYNEGGPAATGQMDIFQYAARTKNYPDPGTNDFLCAHIPSTLDIGENWSWLCDAQLDGLLQTQATQIDFAQRQATLQQISKIIYDNVYFLGLWTDPDLWASTARLQNVRLSGITPLFNAAEWDITQ